MASLNLVDWRRPSVATQISRGRGKIFSTALIGAIILGGYFYTFKPRLDSLNRQIHRYTQQLSSAESVKQNFEQLSQQLNKAQAISRQHQQHARVLAHFIKLLQLTPKNVRLESMQWMIGELKITGRYQHTAAVKALQTQLLALFPAATPDVRFPTPQQFVIHLTLPASA